MEIEIIKTDNENIVIERTIVERLVDISDVANLITSHKCMIEELQGRINNIGVHEDLPKEVLILIEEKKSLLAGEIFSYQEQINKLENLIK